MQEETHYADVLADVAAALRASREAAEGAGIASERIVIDRCPADESLLAYLLNAKFADHLPLYRNNFV